MTTKLTFELNVSKKHFVSNTSLCRTALNRMLSAGVASEISKKKTGRVSNVADSDYIQQDIHEKSMSNAIDACDEVEDAMEKKVGINDFEKKEELVEKRELAIWNEKNVTEHNVCVEPPTKFMRYSFSNCTFEGCSFK